jgi:anaerobic selenocysteine-containing dehydrogenase
MNRRQFLHRSAAAGTLAALAPSIRAADKAGTRKFRTVLIGCGWWGNNILREAMASGACEVVGLCDVDSRQFEATQKRQPAAPATHRDSSRTTASALPRPSPRSPSSARPTTGTPCR